MADEKSAKNGAVLDKLILRFLEKGAETDFKPYVSLVSESFGRCMKLVTESEKADREVASEILRSAVVLNHACLEDFMRTLVLAFLPAAPADALDGIPLAGGPDERAERFSLGKLAQHKGKSVDQVIAESVSKYMERSTFSGVNEIMGFLKRINLRLPDGKHKNSNSIPELPVTSNTLAMLDEMIRRRHHIVHRADRAKSGSGLQPISSVQVMGWLVATMTFALSTAQTAFMKRYSFQEFQKKIEAMRIVYEKAKSKK